MYDRRAARSEIAKVLESEGFHMVPEVISPALREEVVSLLANQVQSRWLLNEPWCREMACQLRASQLDCLLPDSLAAVQCTYFDKSEVSNWFVGFHQDLTIPVKERVESSQCRGWTTKQGTTFVQPPLSVLESLISVRVHLDHNDAQNGSLRVIPRSHRQGRLSKSTVREHYRSLDEIVCIVAERSALVFKPLLLHASSKSRSASPRRVLHFLYGPRELPEGLQWSNSVPAAPDLL